MEFTSVNLIEIIERVIQILQGEFVDNLQWSRDYDPSLPDVHGNQDQLIQAILNVARNACQALQGTERARITFQNEGGAPIHHRFRTSQAGHASQRYR